MSDEKKTNSGYRLDDPAIVRGLTQSRFTRRNVLGAGEARNRAKLAAGRTVPFALLVHTLIIICYTRHGHDPAGIDDRRAAQQGQCQAGQDDGQVADRHVADGGGEAAAVPGDRGEVGDGGADQGAEQGAWVMGGRCLNRQLPGEDHLVDPARADSLDGVGDDPLIALRRVATRDPRRGARMGIGRSERGLPE